MQKQSEDSAILEPADRVVRKSTRRRFKLLFSSLALALSASAAADPPWRSMLLDLNSRPRSITIRHEDEASARIAGDSGSFSLLPSERHDSLSSQHWVRQEPATGSSSAFDLVLIHQPEGSWIWVHTGKKAPGGIPGVLAVISPYVRSFVVDYDPEEVVSEVSLETYRGSVIYCGRVADTHYKNSCSLAHVVLHREKTIRFYALIVAFDAERRDSLLQEFASVLASIELHEP